MFSLTLQDALSQLPSTPVRHWWYLDDGLLISSLRDCATFLLSLQDVLTRIGLRINPKKCVLWSPMCRPDVDWAGLAPSLGLLGTFPRTP